MRGWAYQRGDRVLTRDALGVRHGPGTIHGGRKLPSGTLYSVQLDSGRMREFYATQLTRLVDDSARQAQLTDQAAPGAPS